MLVAWAALAWAGEPQVIDMNSAAELEAASFRLLESTSTGTFAGGTLTTAQDGPYGYYEWIQYERYGGPWWDHVHARKGWWIEVDIDATAAVACGAMDGPGLWIHDGTRHGNIHFGGGEVTLDWPRVSAPLAPGAHTIRVESEGDGRLAVRVDGTVVLGPVEPLGGATEALYFFHSRCPSPAIWDRLRYDTFAPGREGDDDDGDGIENRYDNCHDVANGDQLDTDGDNAGDVCDPCPLDRRDDSDGDGLCDSDDPCPGRVRCDTGDTSRWYPSDWDTADTADLTPPGTRDTSGTATLDTASTPTGGTGAARTDTGLSTTTTTTGTGSPATGTGSPATTGSTATAGPTETTGSTSTRSLTDTADADEPSGCGCTSAPRLRTSGLWLVALWGLRRRRRGGGYQTTGAPTVPSPRT